MVHRRASPPLALTLTLLLLGGCTQARSPNAVGGPSGAPWTSKIGREHPLVGRIWVPAAAQYIDEDTLLAEVSRARFVLVGEQHDNADHHRLQARLLSARLAAGKGPALVAEMLDETKQPALDAATAKHPGDPEAFAEAAFWAHSGWPDWVIYRPVFAVALGAKLPIVAAGVERARTMEIATRGPAAVAPELVATYALDRPLPGPVADALRAEMRDAHCNMMPESMLDAMVLVQRVRDATLSSHLVHGVMKDGAVLIAGNGHVRTDRGVPSLVAHAKQGTVLSIALVEVRDDWLTPAQYASAFDAAALPFDRVWFTPRASDADHCAELRGSPSP